MPDVCLIWFSEERGACSRSILSPAPQTERNQGSVTVVDESRTSLGERAVEESFHGHAAAPVASAAPASVLANVWSEDAIAPDVLRREQRSQPQWWWEGEAGGYGWKEAHSVSWEVSEAASGITPNVFQAVLRREKKGKKTDTHKNNNTEISDGKSRCAVNQSRHNLPKLLNS